jgi:short-subunit dehydrogenase
MQPSRVVAITGASAGIGRATALRLAGEGHRLVLCARRADRLQSLAREIESIGGRALPVVADVTRADDMQRLVAQALSAFDQLDAMMCNAGFGIAGTIDAVSPEQMRRILDVNLFGTYLAARAALPVFRRQGCGHLIVISSIVGKRGVPYLGAYSATKFGQVGLAECLRAELVGSKIHVSIVFPVSTETEFFEVMSRETGAPVERAYGPRQTADRVAEAISRALRHPVPEVFPYVQSRALVLLNTLAPGVCDRVVKRFGRKPTA